MNSRKIRLIHNRFEKESIGRHHFSEDEKTIEFQLNTVNKPVIRKAPNFQNNKLFIAL
jgi:hypothetical protein